MLNRTALTVFLYASFLYFLKRIVFVKRHVWFFRIYLLFGDYQVFFQIYISRCIYLTTVVTYNDYLVHLSR